MNPDEELTGGGGLTYGEAMAVPCPTCGVAAAAECVDDPILEVHQARLKAAQAER